VLKDETVRGATTNGDNMTGRIPARAAVLAATILATGAALAAGAGTASAALVYNNIPAPLPGNMASWAFQATQTSEFGGQVELAGTQRKNPIVTVTMSSWACQNLKAGAACKTTPGSTFEWPITVNVYAVGAENAPGAKIATQTTTFAIPYRPSASKNCTPNIEGAVGWGPHCFHGKTHNVKFHLPGVTLPTKAIISVAYNTSVYGYAPTGGPDVGQDSLNVAVRETAEPGTVVGGQPAPKDAYVYSSTPERYCENSGAVGTFALSKGCWTGEQPSLQVQASK
jgi:hypothetical protein